MLLRLLLLLIISTSILAQAPLNTTIWQVGAADSSGAGFALAPAGFRQFVGRDFGCEYKLFVVVFSLPKQDLPRVLPGRALGSFNFPAAELLRGGSLVLRMSPVPNRHWGTTAFR